MTASVASCWVLCTFLAVCLISAPPALAFTPASELTFLLNFYQEAFNTVVWEDDTARTWDFTSTDVTSSVFNQTNPCGSSSDEAWQGVKCTEAPSSCRDGSSIQCSIKSLDLDSFNLTGTIVNDIDQVPFLTKLVFSNNNLRGSIPPSLGNLTMLKVLKLQNNKLNGSIPPTIGQLQALTNLYLLMNDLSHTLPAELGQLSSLKRMYLYSNSLVGSIPEEMFDNLQKLTSLILFENFLTSTIPQSITKVAKLNTFQINENRINGTLSPTWEQFAETLVVFAANNNLLSGSIPEEFGSLSKLEKLDLASNEFTHEIPTSLSKLTELTELKLSKNHFNGTIPGGFSELINMKSLHLKYNSLTGPIPNLIELIKLQELDLQDNSLNGTIPSHLGDLPNLLELDMVNNSLTGTVPKELSQLTQLTLLSMGYNDLHSTLPVEISHCVALKELKISANSKMSGTIPSEYYEKLTNLEELHLFKAHFTGTIPRSVGNLTKLSILMLYSNRLHGELPGEIGQLSRLLKLSLNGNRFTSSIPHEFASSLHRLTMLKMDENLLTGTIPDSFSKLTSIKYMYLYDNRLTGSIQGSMLTYWTQLNQLDVNVNLMTGTIPSEMGVLTNLRFLRAGANMFSGTLPNDICNLKDIVLFEFQDNLLEGTIPHGISTLEKMYFFYVENNQFSGPLPIFSSNASVLNSIKLYGNQFTGSIPPSYGTLENLQMIILNYNALTGTLPVLLARLEKLVVFAAKYNALEGTLPLEFSRLTSLKGLVLGSNAFTGSLDNIFSNAENMRVDHLDVSDNLFTGTISSSLFQLPLTVLAVSINCFDGKLPPSMCEAIDTLKVLSADGLGASSRCTSFFKTPYFGITLFNGLGGSIPPCVFASDRLEMLHLSGNGLVGSLGEMSNQSVMYDLSLTHNRLRGTIPSSVQSQIFTTLDLSFNDISGTYTEGRSNNKSEIILEVNRLSGNLNTEGLESVGVLNILKGNFFSCQDIPETDEYFEDFSCGSSDLDNALFFLLTAICIAACFFLWFAIMYRGSTGRTSDVEEKSYCRRVNAMTHNFNYYLAFVTSTSSVRKPGHTSLDKITSFCDDLHLISKCIFGIVLASFVFFLPVYLLKIIDAAHSSHMHQYTYVLSVTYATGEVSASLVICAWTLIIISFSGIPYVLQQANIATEGDISARRRNISIADPMRRRGMSTFKKRELRKLTLENGSGGGEKVREEADARQRSRTRARTISDEAVIKRQRSHTMSCESTASVEEAAAAAAKGRNQTRARAISGDEAAITRQRSRTMSSGSIGSNRDSDSDNASAGKYGALGKDEDEDGDDGDMTFVEAVKAILILLVNLSVVGAVNSAYMHYTQGDLSPTERLIVQLGMAIFKTGFAVGAVPVLASAIVNTERNILLRLLMAIFNTLLIPLAVTAFTSSSCLENAFQEADPIVTSYQYEGCLNDYLHITAGEEEPEYSVTCGFYNDDFVMMDVELQPFIPPFTYSYQCASVLLTSYIPVLIFVASFQMLLPFGFVWFQIMVDYVTIPAPLRFAFYGVIWPDHWQSSCSATDEDTDREATDILVLDTNDIVYADILNQLIVLFSFGLCSPMLAAAVSLAFGFKMLMWRMLLGRFVHYRMRLANMKREELEGCGTSIEYDTHLQDEAIEALADATVDFVSVFEMCLWPLLLSSAVFFAIICWDIAGDDVGSKSSLWVPVLVCGIPLCLWISFVFYKKRIAKKKSRRGAKAANVARQQGYFSEKGGERGEDGRVSGGVEMTGGCVVENPINIWSFKEDIHIN